MSSLNPVSAGYFPESSSRRQGTMESLDILQQALRRGDHSKAKECTRMLLGVGRELIAQNVNGQEGINPLPATINLFELISSSSLEWEDELQHDLIRVGRLFIELTCMKAADENRTLSANSESKLKNSIAQLLGNQREEQGGHCYELLCCQEALKLMNQRDTKETLALILKALASTEPTTVIANFLRLLPNILQQRHKMWYADSLYISWAGSTALNDLNCFQSIRNEFAAQSSTLQIAQTFVELFGHLAWNGSIEVQMEALQGEPGLLSLSDIKKKNRLPINRTMWPARLRAVEILSSLTLHPNSEIVTLATNALLERRIRETNPKVLAVLEKLEAQPNIRARWKEQFEVKKETILEENIQAKAEIEGKEAKLQAKEADIARKELLISATNLNAQKLALQERASLLKEREALEQLRMESEQQSKNMQHIYEVMYKTVNHVIGEILQAHHISTEIPHEFYCPIGGNVMEDPVVAEDGTTYERTQIERWVNQSGKSPLTNQSISIKFIPNRNLKDAIDRFRGQTPSPSGSPSVRKVTSSELPTPYKTHSSETSKGTLPRPKESALLLEGLKSLRAMGAGRNIPQAVIHLEQAAIAGNCYAEFYMGFLHSEERSVERKRGLEALAAQGDLVASDLLSLWEYTSSFHSRNITKSAEFYQKAAVQGVAIAQCYLGLLRLETKDLAQAVDWFQKSANQGNAQAQYHLGNCYTTGVGVKKNDQEAFSLFEKGAGQNYAPSQRALGICYEKGLGVAQSSINAISWYQKAAEQGDAEAMRNLGVCYANGLGVSQSYSQAIEWYEKASELHYGSAQTRLGILYQTGQGVRKNERQAAHWFEKAAENGHAEGQWRWGNCLEKGTGVSLNQEKASFWYTSAAGQGHEEAQASLARCPVPSKSSNYGQLVVHDNYAVTPKYKSFGNLPQAPLASSLPANSPLHSTPPIRRVSFVQITNPYFPRDGEGVEKDEKLAFSSFKKAAEQGNAEAQFNLGWPYASGHGVEKDKNSPSTGTKRPLNRGMQTHNLA